MLLILGMYRHSLLGAIPSYQECLKATSGYHVTDWNLMAKSGYVTAVVVLGFLLVKGARCQRVWDAGVRRRAEELPFRGVLLG